jgi:DNA end-binding protein Ku
MARSIWKGAISFGLVSIPVALFTATENKTPKFKMLRSGDSSAIKYKRVAEADGKEVTWDDIVRGYEVEKGRYVVFTDEELEAATSRGGSRVGIAKFALREKEYLATLRADENVLILETMFWPDEIRAPAFEELESEVEVRDEEIKMAEMIIDNLTSPFDTGAYQDPTRGAIEELARKKIEGEQIVGLESTEPTKVLDLLEALKASVEATKEKRAAS